MTNAEWMIKNGYKFSDVRCCFVGRDGAHAVKLSLNGKILGKVLSVSYYAALKEWLDTEHKAPVLDDVERRYLECVLRPLPKVKSIKKIENEQGEYLGVIFEMSKFTAGYVNESLVFPYFETGTMYKGMIADRDYTPKELGLKGLK